MTTLMTMERLNTILEAYGASPVRWPAEERAAAEAMIASSDDARAAFAEAARLDAMLDQAAPPPPVDRLGWRLRGIGPRPEPFVASVVRPRMGWTGNLARVAAVVLAIAGGVAIGVTLPEHGSGSSGVEVASNGTGTTLAMGYDDADEMDSDLTIASFVDDELGLPLQ